MGCLQSPLNELIRAFLSLFLCVFARAFVYYHYTIDAYSNKIQLLLPLCVCVHLSLTNVKYFLNLSVAEAFFTMTHPLLLAEHHWHIFFGRQTDRAEALKIGRWEKDSQGHRNVSWNGLNFAFLKPWSGQSKEIVASDAKQGHLLIVDIVWVAIYILQKCNLLSVLTENINCEQWVVPTHRQRRIRLTVR